MKDLLLEIKEVSQFFSVVLLVASVDRLLLHCSSSVLPSETKFWCGRYSKNYWIDLVHFFRWADNACYFHFFNFIYHVCWNRQKTDCSLMYRTTWVIACTSLQMCYATDMLKLNSIIWFFCCCSLDSQTLQC